MHLLQDGGHALLSALFLSHFGKLTSWNRRLLVTLLKLLVSKEVLRHDARDLFEVIQDSKSRVFDLALWRAEPREVIIQV